MFHYGFFTGPVRMPNGNYKLLNIEDPQQHSTEPTFRRALTDESLRASVPDAKERDRLEKAPEGRVIEVKSGELPDAIASATLDSTNPIRHELALQVLLDELVPLATRKIPPIVARATVVVGDEQVDARYNFGLDYINSVMPKGVAFHPGTVSSGLIDSNRHALAAARLECDLYCASPISQLIGDKLSEVDRLAEQKKDRIIGELITKVDFPDVRRLVNGGKCQFSSVLKLRNKGERFREWLRSEADRDRDAFAAYHNEIGKESDLRKGARKLLEIFGVGLGVASPILATDPRYQALAAAGGVASAVVPSVVQKLQDGWKPVVFGKWASDFVDAEMRKRT